MLVPRLQRWAYQYVVKPILFRFDPEDVHDSMTAIGTVAGKSVVGRHATKALLQYADPILQQNILGIDFANPIGLSAGFDKNAQLTQILPSIGFGFVEVGSVTGEPCAGNPKPRLWRHPDIKSIRVYYGLKNDGAETISRRLKRLKFGLPIGISIAKTNSQDTVELDAGIADYLKAYKEFEGVGSYDTINISCPNAFGGQPFADAERLERLLNALSRVRNSKPMFLKLSPDLSLDELHELAVIAKRYRVDGLIVSNLKKKHDFGKGGLSGKAVSDASMAHLRYLAKTFPGEFILVSCGGIFTAQDAYNRIKSGASLVQLITGMIYQGPQLIGQLNRDLAVLLREDGYSNIAQAVGTA